MNQLTKYILVSKTIITSVDPEGLTAAFGRLRNCSNRQTAHQDDCQKVGFKTHSHFGDWSMPSSSCRIFSA